MALALLVGFYVLALGLAGVLLWIPYAEWVHLGRVHVKLAIGCVVSALIILKASLFVRAPKFEPPGPEVTERDQPRLFAIIQRIAEKMGTSMPRHVYLIPDVNAFVAEVGGFMGTATTRVMGIGVGLLSVDNVSQLEATLAHEFGHYAGGDTRLGGIVYRTRAAIGRVLDSLREHESNLLSKPFEIYGNLYMRVTSSLSRQQELAADRAGAEIAGKEAQITGLSREIRGGVLFDQFLSSEVGPLVARGFRPQNLYDGFRDYARALEDQGRVREIDAALATAATDRWDTHPALADRIAFASALDVKPVPQNEEPARDVLADPGEVERRMTDEICARWAEGRPLQETTWAAVAAKVYAPMMRARGHALTERLTGDAANSTEVALTSLLAALAESRDEVIASQIASRHLSEVPHAERLQAVASVLTSTLGTLLGEALVARGGVWQSELGRPLEVALNGAVLSPFSLAEAAVADRQRLDDIRRHLGSAVP
ncbi:MAG TPA: M48 family metallopeptidase [Myxococcaceae bacterium]|nr:M48 family metallopeptidase [Myxococcaceae bacterium]